MSIFGNDDSTGGYDWVAGILTAPITATLLGIKAATALVTGGMTEAAAAASDPGAVGAGSPDAGASGAAGARAATGASGATGMGEEPPDYPYSGASVIPWVIGLAVLGIGGAVVVSALKKKKRR